MLKSEKEEIASSFSEYESRRLCQTNRCSIDTNDNYIDLVLLSDTHYGSADCDTKKLNAALKFIKNEDVYVYLGGDLIEACNKSSVGNGIYSQLNVQEQFNWMLDTFSPFKDRIVGCIGGNHEERIYRATGIDLTSIFCKSIGVTYQGDAGWTILYINGRDSRETYTMYYLHGRSSARSEEGKMKIVKDIGNNFLADIVAHAHVHSLSHAPVRKQKINKTTRQVTDWHQLCLVTGHYTTYHHSYGQMKGYAPTLQGSPLLRLYTDRREIQVSYIP